MSSLMALREERADLLDLAEQVLSQAERQGRDLSAEEDSELDELKTKIATIDGKIDVFERKAAIDRNATPVITYRQGGNPVSGLVVREGDPRTILPGQSRTFEAMFGRPQACEDFASFNEFLEVLHSGQHHPGIRAASGMVGNVGVDGGYLVPEEYVSRMLDASLENEIVRPRCNVEPMNFGTKHISGWDTSNHTASIGGFIGQWRSEGESFDIQKGLIRRITLDAKKLGTLTAASNELIADGNDFEMQLGVAMTNAIGWYLDDACLMGDGVGKPLGVLSDPALISVAKETGQAADTVTFNNLKAMFGRLHPACYKNAVWIVNNTVIEQLLGLVQYVDNAAKTDYVGGSWVPVLREDGNGGYQILTRPVIVTEKTPSLGDQGDILLADLSQYTIGLRREFLLQKSGHAGFAEDETYYRGILRADGMGRWSGPMTPKNGDTLSWCVTLDERA